MVADAWSLRLPAAAVAATAARRELSRRIDLPGDTGYVACLLTSELVTNAVRHAGLHETETIELRVREHGDRLRVEVHDRGRGFGKLHDGSAPAAPSAPSERGGYGLPLVDELADRWGVDPSEATTVWFELDLERREEVVAA